MHFSSASRVGALPLLSVALLALACTPEDTRFVVTPERSSAPVGGSFSLGVRSGLASVVPGDRTEVRVQVSDGLTWLNAADTGSIVVVAGTAELEVISGESRYEYATSTEDRHSLAFRCDRALRDAEITLTARFLPSGEPTLPRSVRVDCGEDVDGGVPPMDGAIDAPIDAGGDVGDGPIELVDGEVDGGRNLSMRCDLDLDGVGESPADLDPFRIVEEGDDAGFMAATTVTGLRTYRPFVQMADDGTVSFLAGFAGGTTGFGAGVDHRDGGAEWVAWNGMTVGTGTLALTFPSNGTLRLSTTGDGVMIHGRDSVGAALQWSSNGFPIPEIGPTAVLPYMDTGVSVPVLPSTDGALRADFYVASASRMVSVDVDGDGTPENRNGSAAYRGLLEGGAPTSFAGPYDPVTFGGVAGVVRDASQPRVTLASALARVTLHDTVRDDSPETVGIAERTLGGLTVLTDGRSDGYDEIRRYAANDTGDLGLLVRVGGVDGVITRHEGATRVALSVGDLVPYRDAGVLGTATLTSLSGITVLSDGDVLVTGTLSGGAVTGEGAALIAIQAVSAGMGGARAIFFEGMTPPSVEAGVTVLDIVSVAVGPNGRYAVHAELAGPGIVDGNRWGIWSGRHDWAATDEAHLVLRRGFTLPIARDSVRCSTPDFSFCGRPLAGSGPFCFAGTGLDGSYALTDGVELPVFLVVGSGPAAFATLLLAP